MHLSIELENINSAAYGKIHKTGCADLRDPESLGDAETKAEAVVLADRVTSWAENDGEDPAEWGYQFASCVKLPHQEA